jgi:phage tail tape-measure protein
VPNVPKQFNQPGRNPVNQDLWKARDLATKLRWAGRGMMVVGAVQDGTSLYSEYQKSQSTGNYSNTYNEAARVAGGWSGAWAGGQALGTMGATWGLAFGPVGSVVGGALGGLIGGGLGYWGGSTLGSKLVPKN